MPRVEMDLEYEYDRMNAAADVRRGYEAVWWRGTGGMLQGGTRLRGPWGNDVSREIENAYNGGPRVPLLDAKGLPIEGSLSTPMRWAQLYTVADLSSSANPIHQAVRNLTLLYRGRPALNVTGDPVTPMFQWVRKRCGLEDACMRRQAYTIGLKGAYVRPKLKPFLPGSYYPIGLEVGTPDRAIALPDPSNPGKAGVFLERQPARREWQAGIAINVPEHWVVWDVLDPQLPYWGAWSTPEQWLHGQRPIWQQAGLEYPWWTDLPGMSEPLMPVVCTQWDQTADDLLPASRSDLQSVKDLIRKKAWANLVAYAGSYRKALILADHLPDGANLAMGDPGALLFLTGPGPKDVHQLEDSTEAAERLLRMYRENLLEWSQMYDQGFTLREEGGSQPDTATAAMLRLTGKLLLRQQMVTRAIPIDQAILDALRATHNAAIRGRQLSLRKRGGTYDWTPNQPAMPTMDMIIPAGEWQLQYPHYWTSEERREIRAELLEAVKAGRESDRALWLLDHGMEDDRPSGPNWQRAYDEICASLTDKLDFTQRGLDLRPETRLEMVRQTVDDETVRYDVPPEVADTATRGLMLRNETGKGFDAMTPEGKRLKTRATKLRDQMPFVAGEIRELRAWLEAHQDDADPDGILPAGTTAEGNTWLSQGGLPALDWTRGILVAQPETTTETTETGDEPGPEEESDESTA